MRWQHSLRDSTKDRRLGHILEDWAGMDLTYQFCSNASHFVETVDAQRYLLAEMARQARQAETKKLAKQDGELV